MAAFTRRLRRLRFVARPPATVEVVAPSSDPATKALYVDLFRLMCVTPILFAASTTIGDVLVAHQQFLFYALAPILYTGGIVLFGERYGIHATAAGAVAGAAAHLAIRMIGLVPTPFRVRPRFAIRAPAFREFLPEELKDRRYYLPTDGGHEATLANRMAARAEARAQTRGRPKKSTIPKPDASHHAGDGLLKTRETNRQKLA